MPWCSVLKCRSARFPAALFQGFSRPGCWHDTGYIKIHRTCLYDKARGIDLPPEKRGLGVVCQEGRLFPHLSVKSNLVYGMKRTQASQRYIDMAPVLYMSHSREEIACLAQEVVVISKGSIVKKGDGDRVWGQGGTRPKNVCSLPGLRAPGARSAGS